MMAMKLNPYLAFAGNAREAVHFYEKALGGQVAGIMTFGDMPADPAHPLPEEAKNLVMHALLKVGDSELMLSDTFPGVPYNQGDTITIAIHLEEEARAKEVFEALGDSGQVIMALQKTGWSPLFGMVKDKFGVTFQVNVAGQPPQ